MKLSKIKRRLAIITTVLLGFNAHPLFSQNYTVIHNFTNLDGAQPYAGLIASGTAIYSTTKFGGSTGSGTVFTVNADGTGFRVLHNFLYSDGGDITSDLILTNGTLFGAAYQGGSGIAQGGIFSIGENGSSFQDNYIFTGAPDGDAPRGGLLLSGGLLYGTTSTGSTGIDGTVFSIETNGASIAILHTFAGLDGNQPEGDLIMDNGVLYGTTYNGGTSGLGTIFSVQANGSNFSVLHSFTALDGTQPQGGLVLSGGFLYGTASAGGQHSVGTIFSILTNGANFTVMYNFVSGSSSDGQSPAAALCLAGNLLFGTTENGGTANSGTVFSITTSGSNYAQIFSFNDSALTGANPDAPVMLLGNSLYGTTTSGGEGGNGTLFKLQVQGVAFAFTPSAATGVSVGGGVYFGAGGESLSDPAAILQYQWHLNGVNIPGATTTAVNFVNVQPNNGGSVTITFSDGTNALTSDPVGFSVAIATTASSNDNFNSRFQLGTAYGGVVKSSNTNATKELGEPQIIPGNPGGKSIWFRWQPAGTGTAVFDTQGSDFDTMMGVYTGSNYTSLARVPSAVSDDDEGGYLTSQVTFNCVAGTIYDIVVDGYWGASGNIALSWTNESFLQSLPTIIQAPPRQTVVSNGAPVTFICATTNGVVSWLFNGQPTGVTGTNFVISAVDDTNVGTYVAQVTAGGGVTFTEPAHLQISLLEDGSTDTNSVAWNKFLDSTSAAYTNPAVSSLHKLGGGGDTRGYSVAQTFSTVGATGEPGEPSIDGQIGNAPVWYTWVTPTNGAIVINTAGSSFNTMLGVFVGNNGSFTTLTNIGQGYTTDRTHNGQPQVFLPAEPKGLTNFIVVDGYKGASGTVHLNIGMGDPVSIGSPLQMQYGAVGGNATFTVDADGSTPFYYAWQINGTNIPGQTNSSLPLVNLKPTDAGLYTVFVSNLVSATSSSATLSVGDAPVINAEPVPVVQLVGSNATFSVGATGSPVLAYQWYTNSVAVSGATGSSLSFASLTVDLDGTTVSVIVTNNYGVAPSSGALLSVQVPIPPSNVTIAPPLIENILAGGTAVFSVSASGPGLVFYWQLNGVPLSDGGTVSGSSTSVLTLASVYGAYSGTYTVIASNKFGTLPANNAATLNVVDPYITSEPIGSTNLPNTSPTLSVAAIGTASLTYQWLSNGVPVPGANASTLTVANSGQTVSAGYSVIVSNSLGNAATSTVAQVAFTSLLLSDTFSYTSGNLFGVLGSRWTEINGVNSELTDGARVQINETNSPTDAQSLFNMQESGTVLWVSFIINVTALPDDPGGVFFAALDDAAYGFYGRIFTLTTNPASLTPNLSPVAFPGTYRVGIANVQGASSVAGSTRPSAVVPLDLAPGIDYQVVYYLDLAGRVSGLGINPAGLGDVTAASPHGTSSGTATDSFTPTKPFDGFVLLQSAGEGVMELDNLMVSLDWNGPGSGYPVVTQGIAPSSPVIGLQPVGTTNDAGTLYQMEVAASGIGTAGAGLAYAWYQNGVPLSDGNSIFGSARPALTISPMVPTNSGSYYVIVTGAGGAVQSASAAVQVIVPATPPVFVLEPAADTTNSPGDTVTFDSLATGTGPITYAWYFSDSLCLTQLGGETNSDLTLIGLTTNESGTYYVIATGDNGVFQTKSTDANLTVLAPVLPPPLTSVGNLGGAFAGNGVNSVTLTWTAVPNIYTYSVWFATDLSQPFANLVSGLVFSNTVGTYTDPAPTGATKFYEISSP